MAYINRKLISLISRLAPWCFEVKAAVILTMSYLFRAHQKRIFSSSLLASARHALSFDSYVYSHSSASVERSSLPYIRILMHLLRSAAYLFDFVVTLNVVFRSFCNRKVRSRSQRPVSQVHVTMLSPTPNQPLAATQQVVGDNERPFPLQAPEGAMPEVSVKIVLPYARQNEPLNFNDFFLAGFPHQCAS